MGNYIPSWDDRYHMEAQKDSPTHTFMHTNARVYTYAHMIFVHLGSNFFLYIFPYIYNAIVRPFKWRISLVTFSYKIIY